MMKLKLLATVAILAAMNTPAMAADVTLYMRGVFQPGSEIMHHTSGPEGQDPATSTTSFEGQEFKAAAVFDEVYDATTDTSRWLLTSLTSNLPFQVPNSSPRNEYGSDALYFHAMWNPDNGHGGGLAYGILEFGLTGLNLTRNGDLRTLDPAAFNPQASFASYYFETGQTGGFDRPVDTTYARAEMSVDSISLTPFATAVPKPASWALMIGGFGMIGAAARRRVRATTVKVAYA